VTRDETEFLLARLSAAYGRRPATQHVVDEWHRALETLPVAACHRALDQLIADGNPGPNVAQLAAKARALNNTSGGYAPPDWHGPNDAGRQAIAKAKQALADARRNSPYEKARDPW
jgi:hypothetical protein